MNSTIQVKRSAFYVLLLLALCAIPVALAQRHATSQSVAKHDSASKALIRVGSGLPANIIVVTNTNDSGLGSLRDALAAANDGDTIDATGVSGTILLTSGELQINHSVTINGPGPNNLAVDGNAQSGVFVIPAGHTVTISGLTVTNGSSGGGINNGNSTLTLSDCTVSNNSVGIVNSGAIGDAELTVTNCTVSGNSEGGIVNSGVDGDAGLTITNSTISGNSADYGGGISSVAGGINGGSSSVTVSNSTISGNSAGIDGGGIYSSAGRFGSASLSVNNSTLSANSATGNGGGIYTTMFTELELGSTILNAGSSGENIFNNGGTVTSLGYNVSSDDGGGFLIGPGDQINTDPMLGPLQDNGGPTFTHALLPGSPAFDAGDPNFTPPPIFDQRGSPFQRVGNGHIDIGSFEVQGLLPTPTPSPTATATPSPTPTPTATPRATPRPRPTPHPRPSPP